MGRVSRQTADRNRQQTVEWASRLFRARGVENVSIAEIMAAVGLTSGGFYKQFESKQALTTEACSLAFEEAAEAWRKIGQDSIGGDAPLQQLVRHYFKPRPAELSCPMLAFSPTVSQLPDEDPTAVSYGDGVDRLFAEFCTAAGISLRSAEPDALDQAALVFAAMIGTGLLARAGANPPLLDRLRKIVADAAALKPAEPPA